MNLSLREKAFLAVAAAAALLLSAPLFGRAQSPVLAAPGGPVTLTGSTPAGSNVADVVSDTSSARTAGVIHSFRSNGVEKASIDYRGNYRWNAATSPPDCAAATLTLTVAQFLGAGVATCATAQTVNFPTWQGATGIVQSLGGTPAVGDIVDFMLAATGAGAITLGFGTGGSNGNAGHTTVIANTTTLIRCRITSVTANSESATCY